MTTSRKLFVFCYAQEVLRELETILYGHPEKGYLQEIPYELFDSI